MIVIDVNFNKLRELRADEDKRFFYLEKPVKINTRFADKTSKMVEYLEVYCQLNNMLFRAFWAVPENPDQRTLQFDLDLRNAIPVKRISEVKGPEWTALGEEMLRLLRKVAGEK
jgi:hypothetical protein